MTTAILITVAKTSLSPPRAFSPLTPNSYSIKRRMTPRGVCSHCDSRPLFLHDNFTVLGIDICLSLQYVNQEPVFNQILDIATCNGSRVAEHRQPVFGHSQKEVAEIKNHPMLTGILETAAKTESNSPISEV